MSRRPVLSTRTSVRLAAPFGTCSKMLLTDFCNRLTTRAPVDRSIPERAAFTAPTAKTSAQTGIPRGAGPPFGDPTPGETRLTARPRLRPCRPEPRRAELFSSFEEHELPGRGVFNRVPGWRPTSDAPCRASRRVRCQTSPRSQHRFHRPPRQRRTTFPAQSAFHRQVPPKTPLSRRRVEWRPATVRAASPPRAGFRRSFTLPCSRAEGLDHPAVHGLITHGRGRPRAASRLLQPNHDPRARTARPSEPRAPRPRSPVRAALIAPLPFGRGAASASGRGSFRSPANREVTGQGPPGRLSPSEEWLLPPRSLAVEAFPQPDRLGHLLSQSLERVGWSRPHGRRSRVYRESARPAAAFAPACLRGPPLAFPREGERDPPHPRCLPSSVTP